MNKVEIRQRKKIVLPFLLIGTIIIVGTGFWIFFSERYTDITSKKISFIAGVLIFCYLIYSPVRKLIKNQPIIIFESDSIILNNNKPITIKKNEIECISVTYVNETGYFLYIQTKETIHKTNIYWLDRTPDEIKKLINV
ncbi:hypothetical protein D0817_24260 [Flavobacterium cupreum]|uniref:PH domain-containing protein n=1 Tax=Flavobacterium cupreum TaxID=2133766 RepID=A0A434A0G2_9FLAO|nr:hypothetical protein [Flavobacterium cupreum]RUT67855.1 hypothetical protein D0817_24260 [Flavobacterium cupreum]